MGHKRALIVGINYKDTGNDLKGCINDANNMYSLVTDHYGFTDVKLLLEQDATTANIKDNLRWLVSGCRPGDTLLFHYSGHGCFSGDTKIKLLDGTERSLEELTKTHSSTPFWVYSVDGTGNVVPGKAHSPRMTKLSSVIEVKLDNDEVIRCTPNHKFMLRNGEYCEAQHLVPGTSLMPLYTRISSFEEQDRLNGYEKVYIPKHDNWVYTHQMVGYRSGIVENMYYRGGVLHHKNFNKRDNTPENLQFMTKTDHAQLHSHTEERKELARKNRVEWNTTGWPEYFKQNTILQERFRVESMERKKQLLLDQDYQQKYYDGVSNYWNGLTDEERQHRSSLGKRAIEQTRSPEIRARAGASIKKTLALKSQEQKNLSKQKFRETIDQHRQDNKAELVRLFLSKGLPLTDSVISLIDSYPANGNKNHARWHSTGKKQDGCVFCFMEANDVTFPTNHKVVSVVVTEDVIPVFDITVEKYHNFALSSGIVVHNSQIPDTSDPDNEPDSLDEIICPIDLDWKEKVITDDYLKWVFDTVPAGVNLMVFLDSCHSGGALDQDNQYQPPVNTKDVVAPTPVRSVDRYLPPPPDVQALIDELKLRPAPRLVQSRDVNQTGVLISGCRSSQTSADALINLQYQGAATHSLILTLEDAKYNTTYTKLVEGMNQFMVKNGYTQRPELNGSAAQFSASVLKDPIVTPSMINDYEPVDVPPAPSTVQLANVQQVFTNNKMLVIVGAAITFLLGLIVMLR